MEFLWIEVAPSGIDLEASGDNISFGVSTGSAPSSFSDVNINNGSSIGVKKIEAGFVTSGLAYLETPLIINLTDMNGFGFLVATDRINVAGNSTGQASSVVFNWRIFYRYVTVGAEEYIGIVQSQTMG